MKITIQSESLEVEGNEPITVSQLEQVITVKRDYNEYDALDSYSLNCENSVLFAYALG